MIRESLQRRACRGWRATWPIAVACAAVLLSPVALAAPTQQVIGSAVFGPSSVLVIEVGGTTPGSQHDQLIVTGILQLGGELEVRLINGLNPGFGQQFVIINTQTGGGSITGAFASFDFPALTNGRVWEWSTSTGAGVLKIACGAGDANGDGVVTFADVTAVLANFGANYGSGFGVGDANRDHVVSFADVTSVLANFGASCL